MADKKKGLGEQIVATEPDDASDPMMIDDNDLDQMIGGMSLSGATDTVPQKAAYPIYSGDPHDPIVHAPRPKPKPKP